MADLLKTKDTLSLISLLVANLIPIVGVLCFDWDAGAIILLYWSENLILGFYNILKMIFLPAEDPLAHLGKLFYIPFFCLHYGGFCGGHGLFILVFLKLGQGGEPAFPDLSWPGHLVFLQLLVSVIVQLWQSRPAEMSWAFLGLLISHGISFVQNYFLSGERTTLKIKNLMEQPYKRIVVLHIAIIVGGFFVMMLRSPVPLLIILILLKTAMDIKLHNKEHA